MNWKKNTLWVSALIGLMVIGTAVTITVATEAEAIDVLGKTVALEAGECKALRVEKCASTSKEITSNPYHTTFEFEYTKDGETYNEIGTIQTATASMETIKPLIAKECDAIWANLKASNETIDTIIIKPDASSLMAQAYSVITKTWATASLEK